MKSTWCSKHVEAWNKLTCKKMCASSWLITKINIKLVCKYSVRIWTVFMWHRIVFCYCVLCTYCWTIWFCKRQGMFWPVRRLMINQSWSVSSWVCRNWVKWNLCLWVGDLQFGYSVSMNLLRAVSDSGVPLSSVEVTFAGTKSVTRNKSK